MKLRLKRTGQIFNVVNINGDIYTIQLDDGSFKELAASTVIRWYDPIIEEAAASDCIKDDVKSPLLEPQSLDASLVEKARPKRIKKPCNQEFKNKIAHLLSEICHSLGLKIEKRKEYMGAYTTTKKKVVEIRPTMRGIKIAVRPMVFLMLDDNERQQCFYLSERCNLHFRTTLKIDSTDQLELARKLIELSLKDLEG